MSELDQTEIDWLERLPQPLRVSLDGMSLRGPAPVTGASATNRLDENRFAAIISGKYSADLSNEID